MPGPVQALMFIAQNLLAYRHHRPRGADEPKARPQPLQPHALSTDAFKQERTLTGAGCKLLVCAHAAPIRRYVGVKPLLSHSATLVPKTYGSIAYMLTCR